MRRNSVAAVLIVVTIASLALNVYQYVTPRSATVTTTEVKTSIVSCNYNSILPMLTTVVANTNKPAVICVRFYYYYPRSNFTKPVYPLDYISVDGFRNGSSFDASSNFTITAKPGNFSIGGSLNMNEGTIVVYTILAKPGSEGTYNLGFGWLAPQIISCGHEFTLKSGSGKPDLSFAAHCITMRYTYHNTIAPPFPLGVLPNGTVFAELVSAINASAT
jgi:hypothetical protein